MVFGQEMIHKIQAAEKTQTRRKARIYVVGRDYAVQPGRTKKGLPGLRIRITEKRRQRLGEITTADAIAEGFEGRARFLDYWAALHGGVDLETFVYAYTFEVLR